MNDNDQDRPAAEAEPTNPAEGCALCADLDRVRYTRGGLSPSPFCTSCGRHIPVQLVDGWGGDLFGSTR